MVRFRTTVSLLFAYVRGLQASLLLSVLVMSAAEFAVAQSATDRTAGVHSADSVIISDFERKSPGPDHYLNDYLFTLQDSLRVLYRSHPIERQSHIVKVMDYEKTSCGGSLFTIIAYSSLSKKSQADLLEIVEGIKIYSCEEHYTTIELKRKGKGIQQTSSKDLLTGQWPLPSDEVEWQLSTSRFDSKIFYQTSKDGHKILAFNIQLPSNNIQFTLKELYQSNHIIKAYKLNGLTLTSELRISSPDDRKGTRMGQAFALNGQTVSYTNFATILSQNFSFPLISFKYFFFSFPFQGSSTATLN